MRANTLVGDSSGFEGNTQSESSTIVWQPAGQAPRVLTFFNDWLLKNAATAPQGNGFARSFDGGKTFTDLGTLPYTDPAGLQGRTDPVVAMHDDGTTNGVIHFAALSTSGGSVVVFTSTDAGATNSFIDRDAGQTGFQPSVLFANSGADKEWMAVDNFSGSGNGNVYVAARTAARVIGFAGSTNDGASWNDSMTVPVTTTIGRVNGVRIVGFKTGTDLVCRN